MIRLCLYLRVTPICIPPAQPQHNAAVENFNGWFQPFVFQRQFKRPAALRRELVRLMTTVNEHHVQPRLGQVTVARYRRGKRLRKLPAQFELDLAQLPISEERVIFIRWVSARGSIKLLSQTFHVGQRGKHTDVRAVRDTRRQRLTVYVLGRVFKRWPYKLNRK